MSGNCAAINPQDGFLQLIRKKTEDGEVVPFILDEEKTGSEQKWWGAEYYGIKPDLATYAKALGKDILPRRSAAKERLRSIIGMELPSAGRTRTTSLSLARMPR
ncbi:MAG: hypothetical protein U0X87_07865 [Anaerolineales bacterium]